MNVTYPVKDSDASRKDPFYYEGDMTKDTESCAEGRLPIETDVEATLVIPGQTLTFDLAAFNPAVDKPYAVLGQIHPGEAAGLCTDWSGFDVGETRVWDNGTVRISITRQNDDQYKEFFYRLEPSQGQRVGNDPC